MKLEKTNIIIEYILEFRGKDFIFLEGFLFFNIYLQKQFKSKISKK
jgi:hypothetical protein